MKLSTEGLVLAPDAAIDLQVHTHFSDGTWTPEALIEYLLQEEFGLIAITDHERVDSLVSIQELAIEKNMPILVAVEMMCRWQDGITDILCYGFNPENNELSALAEKSAQGQCENSEKIFENLSQKGFSFQEAEIHKILAKPSSQQPQEIFDFLTKNNYGTEEMPVGRLMKEAGFDWITSDIADVVKAAHQSDAVCLIAHPGRDDGFVCYDADLLDQLRQDVPIDGIEVHYPKHSPEQTAMFLEYVQKHDLLMSAGSDSHGSKKRPIKYPAHLSQKLLERVGIQIK